MGRKQLWWLITEPRSSTIATIYNNFVKISKSNLPEIYTSLDSLQRATGEIFDFTIIKLNFSLGQIIGSPLLGWYSNKVLKMAKYNINRMGRFLVKLTTILDPIYFKFYLFYFFGQKRALFNRDWNCAVFSWKYYLCFRNIGTTFICQVFRLDGQICR